MQMKASWCIVMEKDQFVTTFPAKEEFEKAVEALDTIDAAYERIDPSPALSRVAVPALVMPREVRGHLHTVAPTIVFSGWIDYRVASVALPDGPAPEERRHVFSPGRHYGAGPLRCR